MIGITLFIIFMEAAMLLLSLLEDASEAWGISLTFSHWVKADRTGIARPATTISHAPAAIASCTI